MKSKIIFLFIVLIGLTSCTSRLTDFTVISTKSHKINWEQKGERVTGEDGAVIVIIPWGMPNLKEAIDKAIEKAGTQYDALIDGVVYEKFIYFVIGGYTAFIVEGTPVQSSKLKADLIKQGLDPEKEFAEKNIVYHSKTNIDNETNLNKLSVTKE